MSMSQKTRYRTETLAQPAGGNGREAELTPAIALGVVLVSATTLALELLHTRIMSVMLWQSLVYVVITVAMLGFGVSGTYLAMSKRIFSANKYGVLSVLSVCFAVSIVVSGFLIGKISVDAERVSLEPRRIVNLASYFALLALPYLFAGGTICYALTTTQRRVHTLYFLNLAGSAAGCLVFLAALGPLGGGGSILLLSALAAAAGVCFGMRGSRKILASASAYLLLVVLFYIGGGGQQLEWNPSRSKRLGAHLVKEDFPDLRIEFTRWTPFGRVDVASSTKFVEPSPNGDMIPFKEVTVDGAARTWLIAKRPNLLNSPHINLGHNYVFHLKPQARVLSIGMGAGKDIKHALALGAASVTGVDIMPVKIWLVSHLYRDFIGDLSSMGDVTMIAAEGRSFVERAGTKYDIIFMNGVDTFSALSSGAYTLVENYLYTTEAFDAYLSSLDPDGMLSMSRVSFRYPREVLRLTATAVEALRRMGITEPWRHVVVNVDVDWGTLLIKKSPFTDEELAALDRLVESDPIHTLVFKPGLEDLEATPELVERYGKKALDAAPYGNDINPYTALLRAAKENRFLEFCRSYPYNILPVTDDSPFFFKFFRWKDFLVSREGRFAWTSTGGSFGLALLLFLLAESTAALAIFVFLPLFRFKREGLRAPSSMRYLMYFCCLGAAFISVELAMIQRLNLFVGHPTYSLALVIVVLLASSGLGSLVSGLLHKRARLILIVALVAIPLFMLAYSVGLSPLIAALLHTNRIARFAVATALIAPVGVFMGVPFPTALRMVGRLHESFVPWAWGVNGGATVLGSIVAIVLAMQIGFSWLLLVSGAIYLLALVAIYPVLETLSEPAR
jgi:hypothetical protein